MHTNEPITASHTNMSSNETAYQMLKTAILAREFSPGERLKETALASRLGVSRTPLREAFNRLASEGWVEHIPNQGVRVITWSLNDVRDLFAVRLQLEPYATACATLAMDAGQISLLEQHAEDVRLHANSGTDDAISQRTQANGRFHSLLLEAAGNTRLTGILNNLVEMPLVSWTFRAFSTQETQRSVAHHFEIVQAIRARDPGWAESVMRTHILAARHSAIQRLAQAPVDGASPINP